jgi:hypothetical protein
MEQMRHEDTTEPSHGNLNPSTQVRIRDSF